MRRSRYMKKMVCSNGMAGTRTGMTGTHTGAADPMDSYIDLHIKWKYRDKGSMVEMTDTWSFS